MMAWLRQRLRALPIGPGAWISGALAGLFFAWLGYAAVIEPDWDDLRSERASEVELRRKQSERQAQALTLQVERARLLALQPAPAAAASAPVAAASGALAGPLLQLVSQARAQGLQVDRLLLDDGETFDAAGARRDGSLSLEGSFEQILALLEALSAGPEDVLLWPLAYRATGIAGRVALEAQVQAWRAATAAEMADDRKARAVAARAASAPAAASAPRWGSRPAALPPRPAGLRDPFRAS